MTRVPMVPTGVFRCECGCHSVLALRGRGTGQWVNVRLSSGEANYLAREFAGFRRRPSLVYKLAEDVVDVLGWRIAAVRLSCGGDDGVVGLLELVREDQRAHVQAHPTDAVVVAHRRGLPVEVPLGLVQRGPAVVLEDWLDQAVPSEVALFREELEHLEPRDFER